MEFAVTAQIRNKPLYEAVQKLGTQAALAEYLNVTGIQISNWLNLKATPDLAGHKDFWEKRIGKKLLDLTGYSLDEIFPPELRTNKLFLKQQKRFTKFVEGDPQLLIENGFASKQLPSPDKIIESEELSKTIDAVLGEFPPRLKTVMELRFGLHGNDEHTYEEVGAELGVSRERIRQIEAKGLRLLRHPQRANALKPFTVR